MFSGEQDLKQHLISFQEEFLLKLGSKNKLMVKFFPRSLKGDASKWFYNLPGGSIDSFKSLVKLFMGQYKHNIKEQSLVTKLCTMRQGGNETL